MAAHPLAGLALCAGVGGLDLGLRLALGRAYRTVGYVDREAFAAAVLVARMADKALDPAPVWDDIETFDGTAWRGRVDLVSAGFPCQPFSAAGQGRGIDDERWLWPHLARIIAEAGPWGWTCLRAAAVGGSWPHKLPTLPSSDHPTHRQVRRIAGVSGRLDVGDERPARHAEATRGFGQSEPSEQRAVRPISMGVDRGLRCRPGALEVVRTLRL
jgi:hypothetical protein